MSCTEANTQQMTTAAVERVQTAAAGAGGTAVAAGEAAAAAAKATAIAAGQTAVVAAKGTAVSAGEGVVASAGATAVAAGEAAAAAAKSTALSTGQTAVAGAARQAQTPSAGVAATAEAAVRGQSRAPAYTVDSDLTQVVDVSGPALDAAMRSIRPDSPLVGLGQTFVDVSKQQGLNAFFVAAQAVWDSQWGTNRLATEKNNLYGYGATAACPYDCARAFASRQECVQTVVPTLKADYLTSGGKYYNGATLRGMNVKYSTDPNWKDGVAGIMNSLAAQAQN